MGFSVLERPDKPIAIGKILMKAKLGIFSAINNLSYVFGDFLCPQYW